jgi:hypothetical protein
MIKRLPFHQQHLHRFTAGRVDTLTIRWAIGNKPGYPQGLAAVNFRYEQYRYGGWGVEDVPHDYHPEILRFLASALFEFSTHVGVSFQPGQPETRCPFRGGVYVVEFHPKVLPSEPIIIFGGGVP